MDAHFVFFKKNKETLYKMNINRMNNVKPRHDVIVRGLHYDLRHA